MCYVAHLWTKLSKVTCQDVTCHSNHRPKRYMCNVSHSNSQLRRFSGVLCEWALIRKCLTLPQFDSDCSPWCQSKMHWWVVQRQVLRYRRVEIANSFWLYFSISDFLNTHWPLKSSTSLYRIRGPQVGLLEQQSRLEPDEDLVEFTLVSCIYTSLKVSWPLRSRNAGDSIWTFNHYRVNFLVFLAKFSNSYSPIWPHNSVKHN